MSLALRVLFEFALSLLALLFALRAASGRPQRAIVLCSWLALGSALVAIVLTLVLVPLFERPLGPLLVRVLADVRALVDSTGGLLIIAAWLFAAFDALQARRFGWLALIMVGAALSLLAGSVLAHPADFFPLRTVSPLAHIVLLIVRNLVGVTTLVYGLGADRGAGRLAGTGTTMASGVFTGPPPSSASV